MKSLGGLDEDISRFIQCNDADHRISRFTSLAKLHDMIEQFQLNPLRFSRVDKGHRGLVLFVGFGAGADHGRREKPGTDRENRRPGAKQRAKRDFEIGFGMEPNRLYV